MFQNVCTQGGVGAYTDSRGVPLVREDVARFIEARDGVHSNPEHIFLTDGASVAVRLCLNAMIRDENDGILVPIPQYPLYSASIKLYGGCDANILKFRIEVLSDMVCWSACVADAQMPAARQNSPSPLVQKLSRASLNEHR